MRPEYKFDYPPAIRGKYYRRLIKESANAVALEPDIARVRLVADSRRDLDHHPDSTDTILLIPS